MSKAEINNILREIELERGKVKELKISVYHDLNKNVDDLLKNDELNLKKQLGDCTNYLNNL